MGLFDWFRQMASEKPDAASAPPAPELGAVKDESVVQGLDFVAAIEAHRKWKARLTAYIDGTSTEELDPAVICQDDKCALGKWIHGEGKTFCGHMPKFHKLKADHAEFHINPAEVVTLHKNGKSDEARALMLDGAFAQYSNAVQTDLSKLYMEMKA